MARLIDADRLKAHYSWWKGGTREMTMDEAKSDFDTIIDLQPTVDPSGMVTFRYGDRLLHIDQDYLAELYRMKQRGELVEPKHGRWETPKGYPNVLLCSECNTPYEKKEFVATPNYCPNCGADMRGGEND